MSHHCIDTDEISALSIEIAQDFVERVKNTTSDEIFKVLSSSKMLAFAYTKICQEMCKDNLLHPTTRAQLLKGIINIMVRPADVIEYSPQLNEWVICGLPIIQENAIINSKNMVEIIWEREVVPSYNIMLQASSEMLNSVQIQSPGERIKNTREENAIKNTMGATKSSP